MHRSLKRANDVPNSQPPNIAGRLLLKKSTNLLDLGLATGRVVEEIAELAAVGLDVNSSLGGPGIALEDQDLVLGATFLLDGVHRADPSSALLVRVGLVAGRESEAERRRRRYLEE